MEEVEVGSFSFSRVGAIFLKKKIIYPLAWPGQEGRDWPTGNTTSFLGDGTPRCVSHWFASGNMPYFDLAIAYLFNKIKFYKFFFFFFFLAMSTSLKQHWISRGRCELCFAEGSWSE